MKNTLFIIFSLLILTGCGTYSRYTRPEVSTDGLYRDLPAASDTSTIASLPWREMFADTYLQSLIEKGLSANTDLNITRLRVEAAEASLSAAKLAYLPSVGLTAEGGVSRYDGSTAKTYSVGAGASWELDIFGKLTSAKRGAVAALEGSRDYRQAVQTRLIATIADSYYTLTMLDAQLEINGRTLENWRNTVKTLEALKRVGKSNEAGVLQAKSSEWSLRPPVLLFSKAFQRQRTLCPRFLPCLRRQYGVGIWRMLLSLILLP